MIRRELKIDPIAFVCKNLDGVELNPIEQLYLVHKCHKLFKHIKYPSKWAQRLYVRNAERMSDICIENITDNKAFITALKKNPNLCRTLDIIDFEEEVSMCINLLHKSGCTQTLIDLITDKDASSAIVRKIIFLEPRLVIDAFKAGRDSLEEDIEMFIFRANPMLISGFKRISENTATKIIKEDLANIVLIHPWLYLVREDVILESIMKDLSKSNNDKYTYAYVLKAIQLFPNIFIDVIKTLYKNGESKRTSFTLRYLLKELNELIDDQLASLIVEMEEE